MTQPVKALKEVGVLRIGFNPTRSTSPCYNPTHACNSTYTEMNLSTVKWAPSETKPNPFDKVQYIVPSLKITWFGIYHQVKALHLTKRLCKVFTIMHRLG